MFLLAGEQRYFEETLPVSELKDLLDSGSMSSARGQADRIRGLKWLLAMISKGTDVSRFFPDVIRNIMTVNFELKKLAYMYVLHYCDHNEQSRSTSLLSINAFQRDLSDESELIRGLALRTLTSIRVKDILEVQFLAVQTSCRDPSPYVRKIVANSVTKLGIRNQFEDSVLGVLILDSSPSVMGSAAQAMLQLCPDRYDLVHRAFERLCLVLHEVDEFGQVALLKLLSRYVRYAFTNPVLLGTVEEEEEVAYLARPQQQQRNNHSNYHNEEHNLVVTKRKLPTKRELDSFLDDDDRDIDFSPQPQPEHKPIPREKPTSQPTPLTANHKRLLQLALSLLKSRNSSVVMAAAHTSWYCGQRSSSALQQVAQALVRLIKSPLREVGYFALLAVTPLVHERPKVFAMEDFFVLENDLWAVKRRKLELMAFLVQAHTLDQVLGEMEMYIQHKSARFASEAVKTLGEIVKRFPIAAVDCLRGLATIVFSSSNNSNGTSMFPFRVREDAIGVARDILSLHEPGENGTQQDLKELAGQFLCIDLRAGNSSSMGDLGQKGKASLLWLARQYRITFVNEAGDVLRSVAETFMDEGNAVKMEALSLAKCLLDTAPEVATYVLELGKADASSVEVRDWSRLLTKSELAPPTATTMSAKTMLRFTKDSQFEIDSLSFAIDSVVSGYEPIPEWSDRPKEFASTATTASLQKKRLTAPQFSSSSSSSSSGEEEEGSSDDSSEGDTASEEEDQPALLPAVAPTVVPAVVPVAAATISTTAKVLVPLVMEFKPLLSHVRGQGLQIDHCFSRQPATPVGFTSVLLRISNKHLDTTFTNIRLERTDVVHPAFDPIPALPVAFNRNELLVYINFSGQWRSAVRMTLQCDEMGKLSFDVKPPAGELMVPWMLPTQEFDKLQKQLAGMNQVSTKVTTLTRCPTVRQVQLAVQSVGNFALVSEFNASASSNLLDLDVAENLMRFAGKRSDVEGTKVLLEVRWQSAELAVQINCEYALAAQTLLDDVVRALSSHPPPSPWEE
ncbi:hypothetical protein BASA81_002349 [Batrachochytrium salamandrivorans]|nr:hypothetical protein BASA81_002349 [Batrachochytrium salamandrivorans]